MKRREFPFSPLISLPHCALNASDSSAACAYACEKPEVERSPEDISFAERSRDRNFCPQRRPEAMQIHHTASNSTNRIKQYKIQNQKPKKRNILHLPPQTFSICIGSESCDRWNRRVRSPFPTSLLPWSTTPGRSLSPHQASPTSFANAHNSTRSPNTHLHSISTPSPSSPLLIKLQARDTQVFFFPIAEARDRHIPQQVPIF